MSSHPCNTGEVAFWRRSLHIIIWRGSFLYKMPFREWPRGCSQEWLLIAASTHACFICRSSTTFCCSGLAFSVTKFSATVKVTISISKWYNILWFPPLLPVAVYHCYSIHLNYFQLPSYVISFFSIDLSQNKYEFVENIKRIKKW